MHPEKTSSTHDTLQAPQAPPQRQPDASGQERLVNREPAPAPVKPKVMVATQPGTEYWLP